VGFLLVAGRPPSRSLGAFVAVAAVAIATGLVYPLKQVAPVVSLGVVYLLAVMLVSVRWGLWLGLLTSLLSAAAFNFFHIPPVGRFTIKDSANWVALSAFVVVAVAVSLVAEFARVRTAEAEQRQRETDLAAELARLLLGAALLEEALPVAAQRLALAIGARSASIDLRAVSGDERRVAFPLSGAGGQIGTLVLPALLTQPQRERVNRRIVPALESILAAALHRESLQAEVVETAALRRSDEVKTALLRAVSHDLRSPLTTVVAAGHALGADSLTAGERRDLSAAVVEEGARLSALIDKLLDLSRLQAGRAEPHREAVSIEEVLLAARETLDDPGDDVRLSVAGDVPPISVDSAQIERVFANLLENARRYSSGRPVSVHVRRADSRVVARVVDQGPGIARAEQERIFEPFYRGAGGDRAHAGAGLGLAIAKGFVEANGGRIAVESLPGQGTSFVVQFPLEREEVST
jgi:two-component system, OmpR family, sensor histidine kinase KdpD